MAATRLLNQNPQYFDDNGNVLAGRSLTIYETLTSTLATTWSDSTQSTENANPINLDADGRAGVARARRRE